MFYLTGLIGAVIGAAITAIPWIVAYTLGRILGILAFVIGMGAFYGVMAFFALATEGEVTGFANIVQVLASNVSFMLEILLVPALAGIVGANKKIATYTIPRRGPDVNRF
jgi:hypothetical protein